MYFESGKPMFNYDGENSKSDLVAFMRHPQPSPPKKAADDSWAIEASDVNQLTTDNFHT